MKNEEAIAKIKEQLLKDKEERYNNILEYWKNRKPFQNEDDINGCPKVLPKDYQDIIIPNIIRCGGIPKDKLEIGKTYTCRVVDVEDFGIFVELWPGCEGLIHVSQLDTKRVDKPSDMFKVGDEVIAIATGYDKKGKLNLSRKELLKK